MKSNRNHSIALLLTVLFPFGGLIYTLYHWREHWAKNTFWLACIYLGAVFIYCPEGTVLGIGADGGRYVLRLMEMYANPSITLGGILSSYQIDPAIMDLYQPLLSYWVSRYTDNGHVLFAVFAFVFGFFYSRNIWYVLEKLPERKLGGLFILVTLYFLICPISQINGVRMWTALHVFVYAMMPYILERDKSKLWLVVLTPFIHFSYLYMAIFAIGWLLIPSGLKNQSVVFLLVAYVIFVATLFVFTVNYDVINGTLAEYSPETYEERIDMYINEDYSTSRMEISAQDNWYVTMSGNVTYWCYNILLLALFPCIRRNSRHEYNLFHLYTFTLILSGLSNITALIPSGGRFQLLSQMFKVPLFLLYTMSIPKSDFFRKIINVSLVLLLVPFVFEIRKLFEFFSITALLGNFITVFFWENNVPLITIIKRFI